MLTDKLTEIQKDKVASLCEKINDIFTEEDNGFTEKTIEEWHESKLYKGIEEVLNELNRWC